MLDHISPEDQALPTQSSCIFIDIEELFTFKHQHFLLVIVVKSFSVVIELFAVILSNRCCYAHYTCRFDTWLCLLLDQPSLLHALDVRVVKESIDFIVRTKVFLL